MSSPGEERPPAAPDVLPLAPSRLGRTVMWLATVSYGSLGIALGGFGAGIALSPRPAVAPGLLFVLYGAVLLVHAVRRGRASTGPRSRGTLAIHDDCLVITSPATLREPWRVDRSAIVYLWFKRDDGLPVNLVLRPNVALAAELPHPAASLMTTALVGDRGRSEADVPHHVSVYPGMQTAMWFVVDPPVQAPARSRWCPPTYYPTGERKGGRRRIPVRQGRPSASYVVALDCTRAQFSAAFARWRRRPEV